MRTGTLRWRPSRLQAGQVTYGAEVELRLPLEDLEYLRAMWENTRQHPTAGHVSELRTLLDLFAYFPGSRFAARRVVEAEVPSSAMGRVLEEAQALSNPGAKSVGKFHGKPQRTELAGAIAQYPRSGSARRAVLDFIVSRGSYGATDEEASTFCNLRLYTAAPRRFELVEQGWVRDSGRTRETTTGTDAIVWVLTEQGKVAYESIPGRSTHDRTQEGAAEANGG